MTPHRDDCQRVQHGGDEREPCTCDAEDDYGAAVEETQRLHEKCSRQELRIATLEAELSICQRCSAALDTLDNTGKTVTTTEPRCPQCHARVCGHDRSAIPDLLGALAFVARPSSRAERKARVDTVMAHGIRTAIETARDNGPPCPELLATVAALRARLAEVGGEARAAHLAQARAESERDSAEASYRLEREAAARVVAERDAAREQSARDLALAHRELTLRLAAEAAPEDRVDVLVARAVDAEARLQGVVVERDAALERLRDG